MLLERTIAYFHVLVRQVYHKNTSFSYAFYMYIEYLIIFIEEKLKIYK